MKNNSIVFGTPLLKAQKREDILKIWGALAPWLRPWFDDVSQQQKRSLSAVENDCFLRSKCLTP